MTVGPVHHLAQHETDDRFRVYTYLCLILEHLIDRPLLDLLQDVAVPDLAEEGSELLGPRLGLLQPLFPFNPEDLSFDQDDQLFRCQGVDLDPLVVVPGLLLRGPA